VIVPHSDARFSPRSAHEDARADSTMTHDHTPHDSTPLWRTIILLYDARSHPHNDARSYPSVSHDPHPVLRMCRIHYLVSFLDFPENNTVIGQTNPLNPKKAPPSPHHHQITSDTAPFACTCSCSLSHVALEVDRTRHVCSYACRP
jgi:hypothetical protein